MATPAANLKKVEALLVLLKEQHDKASAILEEINELLGGGPGIGAAMKAFEQTYDAFWGDRYARGQRGRYVWQYAQDRPHLKRLLRSLGLEELQTRAANYFASDDPFLAKNRHRFGLFVSGINSYANEAAPVELELTGPTDCQHQPRCKSDVIHTKRRAAEMRA